MKNRRPVTKGKAARGRWGQDSNYFYNNAVPSNSFVAKTKVEAGTYMMAPDSADKATESRGIWGGIPLNMQIRELKPDGTTRLDSNRQIQSNEPFFVTGQSYVSKQGNVVLVEIIPPDGYPGWIEIRRADDMIHGHQSFNDIANETVKYWFAQTFSGKKRRQSDR